MKPKVSLITLGVSDLARSVAFYRDGLGLPTQYKDGDPICFFEMEGTWLSVFPREHLAEDAAVAPEGSGFQGFTLAHNVASPEEVDRVFQQLVDAGATVVRRPDKPEWGGYRGYVADPDGFLWEVAYNPFTDLT